ncbi:hypothetical protein [Jiulongibacter sp. NS-SX5]|uniref:hypothetical protein n=1 Tax=Jiulongibacter sp. NS-SX5 TaxID=3463854 RepID=UPI00405858B2
MLLSNRLEMEANIHTSSIHNQSEAPETLEIKIGLSLPYSNEWDSAKESEGLLEHEGAFYTLVSRDYKNDSLYFKYIKNTNAREVFSMLSEHVDPDGNSSDKEEPAGSLTLKWTALKYITSNERAIESLTIDTCNLVSGFRYSNLYAFDFFKITTPPPRVG